MATLIKILDKIVSVIVASLGALLFLTIGVTIFLTILAKGFIRSVKERNK